MTDLRLNCLLQIDSEDAVAIDIKYHKNCYSRNVTSVLRKGAGNRNNSVCLGSAEIATEFLDLTKKILKDGRASPYYGRT